MKRVADTFVEVSLVFGFCCWLTPIPLTVLCVSTCSDGLLDFHITDSDISNNDVKTYIRAKKDASDILHRFKDKEDRFKDLRQQIWILSRSNLQEVLGVLQKPPKSTPSPRNLSDLHTVNDLEKKDDLALLNLPIDVIHAIGEALAKWHEDAGNMEGERIRKEFPVQHWLLVYRLGL